MAVVCLASLTVLAGAYGVRRALNMYTYTTVLGLADTLAALVCLLSAGSFMISSLLLALSLLYTPLVAWLAVAHLVILTMLMLLFLSSGTNAVDMLKPDSYQNRCRLFGCLVLQLPWINTATAVWMSVYVLAVWGSSAPGT